MVERANIALNPKKPEARGYRLYTNVQARHAGSEAVARFVNRDPRQLSFYSAFAFFAAKGA
jgi:hypothetical protein